MANKEYALYLAEKLKKNPTKENVSSIVKELLSKGLSEDDQNDVLKYIEDEIGNYQVINEHFEIQKQLSVMQMAHQMIAQANAAKANNSSTSNIARTSISTCNIESNNGGK